METLSVILARKVREALLGARFAEAEALLSQLESEDPLSVRTRGLRLELLVLTNRKDEARGLARELTALFPESARIQLLAGQLAFFEKQYAAALVFLRESERLHSHPRTRRYLGKALTALGRLDEAEALLAPLGEPGQPAARDLAWLLERKGEPARAQALLEAHLARGEDAWAKRQLERLRVKAQPPEDLIADVQALSELGVPLSEETAPGYVEALLKTGRSQEARAYLEGQGAQLSARAALQIAWVCQKALAFDLAYPLFVRALPDRVEDYKFRAALERAAERLGKLDALCSLYQELAPAHPLLYGRLKILGRKAAEDR